HRLAVVMRVHVDPARRDQTARGIDVAPGWTLLAADPDDAVARDRHVAGEGGLAGAVDDGAAANDNVVHGSRSCMLRPDNDAPAARGTQRSLPSCCAAVMPPAQRD